MNTNTLRNAISTALLAVATGTTGLVQADDTRSDPRPSEGHGPGEGADRAPSAPAATDEAPVQLETLAVTGSRIRGGATPSAVVTVDSQRIREEGFADLGDVIRSLPQNFAGGQGPGIAPGATGGGQGNQNITGGSGLNLRGLGQDASLTLLNGRRMAYGGFVQMVDISAIPVAAVDRIEVVADGASAVYGSDAVGGVANVILRRDFDGVAVGTRHATATGGGLDSREYSATGGTTWSGGGLVATWVRRSNDPVFADQRDYTADMFGPTTLYQGGELRSGLVSGHQSLGPSAELRLDAFRTERSVRTSAAQAASFERSTPETTTWLVAPGVEVFLPGCWTLSLGATRGREATDAANTLVVPGAGTSTTVRTAYRNTSRSVEAGAEGPVWRVPAGDVRLAVGAGYRANGFQTLNPDSGLTQVEGDVRSRYAYAEASLPLVGPGQGVTGIRQLGLTAALRSEDYDSFGGVTTPRLGLVWGPGRDVTVKASWGRSFKVPTLSQQFLRRDAILFPAVVLGGTGFAPDATALYLVGGNPDLDPERARTWSASLAVHPEALPGLEAELTWFDIDYTDRVVQPIVPAQALADPAFAAFIRLAPTPEELAEILAAYRFTNATGAPLDPARVVAIAPNIYINTARQRARGIDLSGSYRFELATGALTLRGSATWLDSTRQVSAGQPARDLSGTLFHPARLNGRVGAVWDRGGFTASLFGNHTAGVTNPADGRKGGSFNTLDLTLRHDTGAGAGAWSDIALELSAHNLLDRAPPLYAATSPAFAPYDSTNYSAVGRYVAVAASKRW
ncbi:MAG: TonB-dependent receptor plug domain-containing protein [Lysobacteraceae bacterium]